jgi:hypothetical protein
MEVKLKHFLLALFYMSVVIATKTKTKLDTSTTLMNKRFARKIEYIQDPRQNTSFYDIILTRNQKYGSLIGNVGEILSRKRKIAQTNLIFNYKLIYYSPQIIPSSLFSSKNDIYLDEISNEYSKNTSNQNQTSSSLFSVNAKTGAIHMNAPSDEPTLEYLCMKRKLCSCFSCIFSLNLIYSTENKINTESVQVFIDDENEHAPVFRSTTDSSSTTTTDYLNLNVSESSQIGDYFSLAGQNAIAYDLDAYYNEISYYLSDNGR